MNNSMPTNLITEIKKINFLKDTIYKNLHKDDLIRPISIKAIESITIITFQIRNRQAHMGSLVNSTKYIS